MVQSDKNNPYFNSEGYPDPTAYAIIKKEQDLDKKVGLLVKVLKAIIYLCEFELVERIILMDKKTGKIFK